MQCFIFFNDIVIIELFCYLHLYEKQGNCESVNVVHIKTDTSNITCHSFTWQWNLILKKNSVAVLLKLCAVKSFLRSLSYLLKVHDHVNRSVLHFLASEPSACKAYLKIHFNIILQLMSTSPFRFSNQNLLHTILLTPLCSATCTTYFTVHNFIRKCTVVACHMSGFGFQFNSLNYSTDKHYYWKQEWE